jgi:urea transporter
MPGKQAVGRTDRPIPFIDAVLKGLGQIMFQGNRWTGLALLAGLFLGHWHYGLAALMAASAGTALATALKFDAKAVRSGLYGFSAALVGVVLVFYFRATWGIWVLALVGGGAASLLQHAFIRWKVPGNTFPFIAVSWLLIFLLQQCTEAPLVYHPPSAPMDPAMGQWLCGTNGFGQVIFQGKTLVGILFLTGVLLNSRIAAVYGLLASFAGAWIAQAAGQPAEAVGLGLFGYNTLLSAMALAGPKLRDALWALIAVGITAALQLAWVVQGTFDAFGGVLTFPFVAGTWLTLALRKLIQEM